MARYGNTILTSAGLDLAKRTVNGTSTFKITRVVTSGDSTLQNATIEQVMGLTSLNSIVQTGTVTAFDTSNPKQIGLKAQFVNRGLTDQYKIFAVGIYAQEAGKSEILYAVTPAVDPETMPARPSDSDASFTFTLQIYAAVANSSSVTISATTEGVVKSVNGTIKPDANGNVTMSYYSQAEVDQKVSALSSRIDSLNSTKASSADLESVKSRVSAVESGKADKTSVYDKTTADSRFVNTDGDSMTGNLVLDSTHHLEHLGGVVNFSKSFEQLTSIKSLINALTPLTGCSGSFQLTAQDGQLSPSWYNFVWMPHRSGGISGGDNGDYGTMLLVPFGGGSAWIVNYSSGVTNIKALAWDDNLAATTNIANAAKTEADANANSIQALATQVNQNSSKITDNTTAISSLSSTVSNLRVGDRNLARGVASSKDWLDFGGFNNLTNYCYDLVNYSLETLKAGDTVTFGITMKNDGIASGTMYFQQYGDVSLWNRDHGAISPGGNVTDFVPNGAEKALTYTITVTDGMLNGNTSYTIQIRTDNVPAGGKLSFRYAFVKKGTMATDWTPAPEDVENEISKGLASEVTARTNGDNSVLSQAKAYTDAAKSDLTTAMTNETMARTNADNSVLAKANAYTDFALRQVWTPAVITTAIDLNNVKACGSYFIKNTLGTTSNTPIPNAWLFVRVEGVPTRITQTVWKDIDPAIQWVRVFTDTNSWGNWTQITKAI